jgi:uncharacterized protein YegJ (DUF2314 family)
MRVLNRPLDFDTAFVVAVGALGAALAPWAVPDYRAVMAVACLALSAAGLLQWRGYAWGCWVGVAACALLAAAAAHSLYVRGFSLLGAAALAGSVWGAYAFYLDRAAAPATDDEEPAAADVAAALVAAADLTAEEPDADDDGDEDDDESPSLVLLLPKPRHPEWFTADYLTGVIEATFGRALGRDGAGMELVAGVWPAFIAQFGGRIVTILHRSAPYFDDPAAAAASLPELRVAHAVREHRAFLALSLHDPGAAGGDPYRTLGPLAVALAEPRGCPAAPAGGSAALAVYWPDGSQVRVFDDETRRRLAGDDPLSVFRELHLEHPPVLAAPDDDPRLAAAVEEARRRWPEFVAAFAGRQAGQTFAVKAAVREGEALEFMWLTVDGLDGDEIRGRLDNDPVGLKQVRRGDQLAVDRADLNDWLFTDDAGLHGAFTVRPLKDLRSKG